MHWGARALLNQNNFMAKAYTPCARKASVSPFAKSVYELISTIPEGQVVASPDLHKHLCR